MTGAAIESWRPRLEAALLQHGGPFRRVHLLRETASTQDAARLLGAEPGEVVVAGRQTAGRGRLGRRWADTAREGVAASFVCNDPGSERLAVAAAVAAARAVEAPLGRRVGIKWPNDVVDGGRKLAGVLIECRGGRTVIGIGINVGQRRWPEELAARAVSLAQLGARAEPVEVLAGLLRAMNEAAGLGPDRLRREYAARDVLAGRRVTLRSGTRTVTGTVLRIDPMQGLLVRDDRQRETYLRAATTSVVSA